MLAKVFARGRGGGRGPVEYLVGNDLQRPEATVLRGEPDQIRELINQCPFSRKYTSAVLSFAESDISDELRWQCINEFEATLLPGLDYDQYDSLWVEHRDKGRVELHCVIANTELLTGKRLQPFYADADLGRVNQWKTAINSEYGLADPSDPSRRQSMTIPKNLPKNRDDALKDIKSALEKMAEAGKIQNRDDVVNALNHAGIEVTRKTKSSISIRPKNKNRNIRLTGTMFRRDFTPEKLNTTDASAEYDSQRLERGRDARARWHSMIEHKAAYNRQRYQRPPTPQPEVDHGPQPNPAAAHRHSQEIGISFNRDIHRARRAIRQARSTIKLTTALDGLKRCRAIADTASGYIRQNVLHPIRATEQQQQALGAKGRTTLQASMQDLSAFSGFVRRGDHAVPERRRKAAVQLQWIRCLQQSRPIPTPGRAEATLHDVRAGQWGSTHPEGSGTTPLTQTVKESTPDESDESDDDMNM